MNVFSADEFLTAVAEAHYPSVSARPRDVLVDGRAYRVLVLDGDRPVLKVPFLDFYEEAQGPGVSTEDPLKLRWLPAVSHGFEERERWLAEPKAGMFASPRVDWSRFPTWESYVESIRDRPGPGFGKSAEARRKKLEKAVGPLRFVEHENNRAVLKTCMGWKSLQYQKSQYDDLFARGPTAQLFERLFDRGMLRLACLYAGDQVLAAHAGLEYDARFYYWLPAYDPSLQHLSPGTVLLHEMLEASYRNKHSEFDFLLGNESYKWKFATDTRLIAPCGSRPLHERAWLTTRKWLVGNVRRFPVAYESLRAAKRWAKARLR